MNPAPPAPAPSQRPAWAHLPPRAQALLPPLALALTTLLVLWQYDPLHRPITLDPGIFAYLSQLVAQGFAPHKYAFNEQSSLAFLLGGAAMRVGDLAGWPHLLSYRFAAMLVMAVAVALTYSVARRFTRSRFVGLVTALILIGYQGYGVRAATTLEPKSLALALGLAALLFLQRRSWGWAGVCAGAAGLAWQIAWLYLLVALWLALVQGGPPAPLRGRAVALVLAGALAVFAIYTFYFVLNGALVEMLQQTFLAPPIMHDVATATVVARLAKLARTFSTGFGSHTLFGVLGGVGLVAWLVAHLRPWDWRRVLRRSFYFFSQSRRTAGALLITLGFAIYSYLDFQNYPDWIPLLPFISLMAAWLLWRVLEGLLQLIGVVRWYRSAVIITGPNEVRRPRPSDVRDSAPWLWQEGVFRTLGPSPLIWYAAVVAIVLGATTGPAWRLAQDTAAAPGQTWQAQAQAAQALAAQLGPDARVWVLGKAELLFFMQKQNLTRYLYVLGRVDAAADAFEPGGFAGMFNRALAEKPALFVLARADKSKFASKSNYELVTSAPAEFVRLKRCPALGGGQFLVRPDLAAARFPTRQEGCPGR